MVVLFPISQYLSDNQRAVFAWRCARVTLALFVDDHGFHRLRFSVTQPRRTAGEGRRSSTQTHYVWAPIWFYTPVQAMRKSSFIKERHGTQRYSAEPKVMVAPDFTQRANKQLA